MRKGSAALIIFFSVFLGGGSIAGFLMFLYVGSWEVISISQSAPAALLVDALISFLFFFQHSAMIRGPLQRRVDRWIPEVYSGAVYSIASGLCLCLVLVLWQRIPFVIYWLEGGPALIIRVFFFLPFAGFLWSSFVLDVLDPLGVNAIWLRLRGRTPREQRLVTEGPYQWVRHPMYTGVLVLLWACPVLTADRLFFNLLWSAWVIAGARMEERGLLEVYGDAYRSYQKKVPMLIPSARRART